MHRTRHDDLHIGQAVHVNARSAWLPATIVSIAHTRVGVAYHTDTPVPLARTVEPWVIRPAAGTRLEPVDRFRHGDEVVGFDGTVHMVQTTWQGRDRWWVVTYAGGERVSLPPGAVLRLADHTPAATYRAPDAHEPPR